MGQVQDGKNFFGRNNKSRSSAFRKFLFYKNIICFDWVMNLFLSRVMFSIKKVSFPAKTAVGACTVFVDYAGSKIYQPLVHFAILLKCHKVYIYIWAADIYIWSHFKFSLLHIWKMRMWNIKNMQMQSCKYFTRKKQK